MHEEPVAVVVGRTLAALGVGELFGLTGSGNFVVTRTLVDCGARFHAARHEGGAVAAADGWARVSGGVGVASVHQGPGLTNTLTALAEAAKARTPLLLLAGDTPAAALRSNFRIDQHGLVRAVGAIPELVHRPETAAADAARAYRRAALERRPVVLMLPIDVQAQLAPPFREPRTVPLPPPTAPDPQAVRRAAALLRGAERPVVIAGRGARDAGPVIEVLAERMGALLATSAMANGLFGDLPFALGIAGGFATPLAAELLPEADVVLVLGATLNHWTTRHGALIGPDAQLVQVDRDPAAIGAHHPVAEALTGDVGLTVAALTAALGDHRAQGHRTPGTADRIAARRWRHEPFTPGTTPDTVDPRTLARALDDLLPADRAVVVDSGHLTGWPAMFLPVRTPGAWVFCNAFQAVGLGLGAAIGAATARPERITVAALGDGGLFLALQELDTAARLGLRLLVVVWDDAAYGAEVHHFAAQDTGIARFPDADLAAIARGAGVAAVTVRHERDLEPVRAWAADPQGPLLVDAKVDPAVVADWLAEAFKAG